MSTTSTNYREGANPLVRALRVHLKRHLPIYLFFVPAFILVSLVSFLPLFYAIRQSFFASRYLELGEFIGLGNYVNLLTRGGGLANIGTSLVYVLGTLAITMPLGFALALLLNRDMPLRATFRTILVLPWVVSQLVTALLWMWLLNNRFGPVAYSLGELGISFPSMLTSTTLAMPALVLANSWGSYPLVMLFAIAALQTIPSDLLDAARIDGASGWQSFWNVTFPLIKNTVLVALVLTTLTSFNMVTLILLMTGGGPAGATDVLALRIFKEGFQFYRMGMASAAAVVIFLINIVFTILYIRVLRAERR
jgi:ABC-type sugar transport system permease subunit